jgi:hypothetical protein
MAAGDTSCDTCVRTNCCIQLTQCQQLGINGCECWGACKAMGNKDMFCFNACNPSQSPGALGTVSTCAMAACTNSGC